ncbi:MAG: fumarate hydratase [Endomicrobium sp.]|nr:fumarate hydratase [Endomicrobium sp.]
MRRIESNIITEAIKNLCAQTNYNLPDDVLKSINSSICHEESNNLACSILKQITENAAIAKEEQIPLCQDTGTANFFVKIGQEVYLENGNIYDAINRGVSLGYRDNYLRKSIVSDPLERKNTNDNTPASIYIDIVPGDKIEITFLPKGGGSENASALKMLTPSVGWEGVKDFVLNVINDKGRNACPPLIVGVGIGGDFASVGLLAKKALLREIGSKNKNEFYTQKERELLFGIDKLNIGPMGMSGKTTALAVFINTKPTHIASLPVAVNIQCHSCRRRTITI